MAPSSSRRILAALLLCAGAGAGCMAPPVVWRNQLGERQFAAAGNSLVVLPLNDRRELHNGGASPLNYVPLILWTTQVDEVFDLVLRQPGSKRGSVPNPAAMFVATRDLHEAMAQQLGHGRRFGPVFRSRDESGPWGNDAAREHTLLLRLNKLTRKQVHLRYGLGPLAFGMFAVGAPNRHVRLDLDWRLELRDAKDRLIYESDQMTSRSFYDGWYFNSDAEQRMLDEIAFILADDLDKLQESCAVDAGEPSQSNRR